MKKVFYSQLGNSLKLTFCKVGKGGQELIRFNTILVNGQTCSNRDKGPACPCWAEKWSAVLPSRVWKEKWNEINYGHKISNKKSQKSTYLKTYLKERLTEHFI